MTVIDALLNVCPFKCRGAACSDRLVVNGQGWGGLLSEMKSEGHLRGTLPLSLEEMFSDDCLRNDYDVIKKKNKENSLINNLVYNFP